MKYKMEIAPDLSIIVPVYQVEHYIRPCIESIFNQGIEENRFEVIIVNDDTKDHSIEMIEDIIQQHSNITVINHPKNLSLSVARKTGITAAKGEYILMPDSDDLLIENALLPLLNKAIESKVDLVVADFLQIKDGDNVSFSSINQGQFCYQEKTGEQLFLEDLSPYQCYVWRALYRRSFILDNHLSFIPGINYQDVPFTHECYLKAQRCIKTNWLFYIYRRDRAGAATTYFSVNKARSFSIAIANTWNLTKLSSITPKIRFKLEDNVYTSVCLYFYHTIHSIKKSSERKQAIQILNSEAPHLNFKHGIRQKLTTFMIRKMPYFYIELYYYYAQIAYRSN